MNRSCEGHVTVATVRSKEISSVTAAGTDA